MLCFFLGPASQVCADDRFAFGSTGPRLASEVHGPRLAPVPFRNRGYRRDGPLPDDSSLPA